MDLQNNPNRLNGFYFNPFTALVEFYQKHCHLKDLKDYPAQYSEEEKGRVAFFMTS